MEAQYVAAVMNRLEKTDNSFKKHYGAVAVITHSDGSVSVGFSGKPGSPKTAKAAEAVNRELQRLNEERRSRGIIYNKEYHVSGEIIPNHALHDVTGGNKESKIPKLNQCAEPKAIAAAHSNKHPITGMDVVWRGSPLEDGRVPHQTDEYGNNRIIHLYEQMSPCEQCQHNVMNYWQYGMGNKTGG